MKKLITFHKISLVDKKIFNEVFNELYIPLVFFAKSYLNDDQEQAEDLVQDVFTNILSNKTKFRSKKSLKSYMFKSVKNSFLNYQKHNEIKQLYIDEKKANSSAKQTHFLDKIIEAEVKYQLIIALDSLPVRCKKVFELSLKGFKNNEIALEMGITTETVKSHKKKGKKLLTSILKIN